MNRLYVIEGSETGEADTFVPCEGEAFVNQPSAMVRLERLRLDAPEITFRIVGYEPGQWDTDKGRVVKPPTIPSGSHEPVGPNQIDVYTREECPFNYCDDPEICQPANRCHYRPDALKGGGE